MNKNTTLQNARAVGALFKWLRQLTHQTPRDAHPEYDEIADCPFCGAKALKDPTWDNPGPRAVWYHANRSTGHVVEVRCGGVAGCYVSTSPFGPSHWHDPKLTKKAIAAWNRRAK